VSVPVVADPKWVVSQTQATTVTFPKQAHLLGDIRGPLVVIGGAPPGTLSFAPAVMLPGEKNAPLFGLRNQPPEVNQIDVLNVFDDGANSDMTGTLTATNLSGLGMGGDLTFARTAFNEPTRFAGRSPWPWLSPASS